MSVVSVSVKMIALRSKQWIMLPATDNFRQFRARFQRSLYGGPTACRDAEETGRNRWKVTIQAISKLACQSRAKWAR